MMRPGGAAQRASLAICKKWTAAGLGGSSERKKKIREKLPITLEFRGAHLGKSDIGGSGRGTIK